jgi:hypothetical protein
MYRGASILEPVVHKIPLLQLFLLPPLDNLEVVRFLFPEDMDSAIVKYLPPPFREEPGYWTFQAVEDAFWHDSISAFPDLCISYNFSGMQTKYCPKPIWQYLLHSHAPEGGVAYGRFGLSKSMQRFAKSRRTIFVQSVSMSEEFLNLTIDHYENLARSSNQPFPKQSWFEVLTGSPLDRLDVNEIFGSRLTRKYRYWPSIWRFPFYFLLLLIPPIYFLVIASKSLRKSGLDNIGRTLRLSAAVFFLALLIIILLIVSLNFAAQGFLHGRVFRIVELVRDVTAYVWFLSTHFLLIADLYIQGALV